MQEKNYKDVVAFSQSAIKDFRRMSPKSWKKIWIDKQEDTSKKEEIFVLGNLLDTLLFKPDLIDSRFFISDVDLPSVAIVSIVKSTYQNIILINQEASNLEPILPEPVVLLSLDLKSNTDLLINAADNYENKDDKTGEIKRGWYNNWKEETRINSLLKDGEKYFEILKNAKNKTIISSDLYNIANELVNILKNDELISSYFIQSEGCTLLHQLEIYTDYTYDDYTFPLKGALDIVKFNHKEKTVQEADFKSTYSAFYFIESVKKLDYCGQHSFYDSLLREWLKTYEDGKYKDYDIVEPINIVIDLKDKEPYVFKYNMRDLSISKLGNEFYLPILDSTNWQDEELKYGKFRKGWLTVLQEIMWHHKNNLWNKPIDMYKVGYIDVNLLNN